MYYLTNFILFSILGFFFETSIFKIFNMHKESGFMYLWWTPFYGSGVIIANIVYKYLSKKIKKKLILNIVMFITFFILLSILEYVGGIVLEVTHGYSLWNYKHFPLHIGKYISIPTSLLWATLSMIYIYFIKKYSDKLVSIIPNYITILSSLIFFVDLILTIIKLIYRHII